MKKRLRKRLELSRETLRSIAEPNLREAAGGGSDTCVFACGSGANTVCFKSCACTSPIVCE